jgi:hypothetical protein
MNERWTDMNNADRRGGLEMRWLPVVDASGHTRMEATWVQVGTPQATARPTVTHAA